MKVFELIKRCFSYKNCKNNRKNEETSTKTKKGCRQLSLKLKFLCIALGAAAGLICGLLGTGGGIILVFALRKLQNGEKTPENVSRDAFAETIAIILAISVVSALVYYRAGNYKFSDTVLYLPSAALGGYIGAILTSRLKITWLSKIFAILVIWAGGCMIFS